jgi:hypothetical protein
MEVNSSIHVTGCPITWSREAKLPQGSTTMIDIHAKTLIWAAETVRLRPAGRRGHPIQLTTIYRWMTRGARGIRLDSIRIGGCNLTPREALQGFAEDLTAPASTLARVLPSSRRMSLARASHLLDRLGI